MEKKNPAMKFRADGKYKEADPNIPLKDQMTFEEYIEQVFLCLIQNEKFSITEAEELIQRRLKSFQMYFKENWEASLLAYAIGLNML